MSLKAASNLIARYGREGDSVLVHMSPEEVRGLQQLAEMHGGSLSINPNTGLPEAGFLSDILPMLASVALNFIAPGAGTVLGEAILGAGAAGASALGSGLISGGITGLATGSLEKGLMAGLGAYGGVGLSDALASTGAGAMNSAITDQILAANAGSAPGLGLTTGEIAREMGTPGFVMPEIAKSANPASAGAFDKLSAGVEALKSEAGRNAFMNQVGGKMGLLQKGLAFAAPMLSGMSERKMPEPGGAYPPTAAIHPSYAYRDQEGNVKFVDLPGVKMADWKPEQSVSQYAQSMVAEPEYEERPRYAADGGLMDAYNMISHNEPVVRMAGGGVSDADVQNWFAANPGASDAAIASAMQQYSVSPEQVARVTGVAQPEVQQRYESAIAPQIVAPYTEGIAGPGGTTSQYGTGYLNMYNQLQQAGISPQELYGAVGGAGSWTAPQISRAYDVAGKVLQFDPLTDTATPSDKAWAMFMDANRFSPLEIAQATGLSEDEVLRRYNAAKATIKPTTVPTTSVTPGGVPGGTIYDSGAYGAYGSGPATGVDYLGRTTSIATPGDIITNPDDTRTVVPNIPGRPYGGFTGMDQVKSAYTAGGGRLGQVLTPTKTYQNTGLSGAAYDYLMGKGAWPTYTQKPPLAADTFSDIKNPEDVEVKANTSKLYVWQGGKMVKNPWYGKTTATPDSTVGTSTAEKQVETAKDGGLLAAYAHGGRADLGDYSDGGRLLRGPGDGVSDNIPAVIGNRRPARLADGEFVVPARIVSEIGNGSTEAGARKLYAMMERVQQARKETVGKGRSKVAKNTRADKYLPA